MIEVQEREPNNQAKNDSNAGVSMALDVTIEAGDEEEERLPF